MGTRGPKPTPTKVLQLRGSWRGHTRPNEPTPKAEKPACPDWLDAEGKKVFRHLVTQLHAIGLLGKIDQHALGRYVRLFQRWKKMEAFLTQYGEYYAVKDEQGRPAGMALWPQVGLAMQLADKLLRLEQHFGMTPAARASIGQLLTAKPPHADESDAPTPQRFLKFH